MNQNQNSANAALWWSLPSGSKRLADDVFTHVAQIERSQSNVKDLDVRHMRMYGGADYLDPRLGHVPPGFNLSGPSLAGLSPTPSQYNVARSVVDTATALVTVNQPRPQFQPIGGDWTIHRRCRRLQRFVDGQFKALGMHTLGEKVFRDACILGSGFIKFFHDGRRIRAERVCRFELKVDAQDGYYGTPRQLHHVRLVSKNALLEQFGDDGETTRAILAAGPVDLGLGFNRHAADLVTVVESWRLPSTEDADDGRHTLCIQGCAPLHDERWTRMDFPFAKIDWNQNIRGYFGTGLVQEVATIQRDINRILQRIHQSIHLMASPKWIVDQSCKIADVAFDNRVGTVMRYSGARMPEVRAPGFLLPPEVHSHLERLYQKAYELAGVSQLAANSQKPAGVETGVAIRAYSDIGTMRFAPKGRAYENLFLECAHQVIETAREMGDVTAMSVGKRFSERISWSEVDLERDAYVVQAWATNLIQTSPVGKLQTVMDLAQLGQLTPEQTSRLLDLSDVDAEQQLMEAAEEDIDRTIEMIAEEGVYVAPEPYQKLDLGVKKMQMAYLRYRDLEGMPPENLELMRQWIDEAQAMQDEAAQAQQQQQAPGQHEPQEQPPQAPPAAA